MNGNGDPICQGEGAKFENFHLKTTFSPNADGKALEESGTNSNTGGLGYVTTCRMVLDGFGWGRRGKAPSPRHPMSGTQSSTVWAILNYGWGFARCDHGLRRELRKCSGAPLFAGGCLIIPTSCHRLPLGTALFTKNIFWGVGRRLAKGWLDGPKIHLNTHKNICEHLDTRAENFFEYEMENQNVHDCACARVFNCYSLETFWKSTALGGFLFLDESLRFIY